MRWALAMVGFAAACFVSVDASAQTACRTQARDDTSPTGTRSDIPEHVLERVEGVKLQMESHRPGWRVSLLSGGGIRDPARHRR
jgi:hypothetical protein